MQGLDVEFAVQDASPPVTRVWAPLVGVAPAFVMEIRRPGDLDGDSADQGDVLVTRTGNRAFDAAFRLRSNDGDAARSLVDRRVAQLVSDFPRCGLELRVERNRCCLAWPGSERDQAIVDLAVDLVFTACRPKA
jgi:hypothetical protein